MKSFRILLPLLALLFLLDREVLLAAPSTPAPTPCGCPRASSLDHDSTLGPHALPPDCQSFGPYGTSGCANVEAAPSPVQAGGWLTVTYQRGCGATIGVGCSYAIGARIGGKDVPLGGTPPEYFYDPPAPFPTSAGGVTVPSGGGAVLVHISANAPNDCVRLVDGNYPGPWAWAGGGSPNTWSSFYGFKVVRSGRPIIVDLQVATANPDGAEPGETITYTIDASTDPSKAASDPNATTKNITLHAAAPPGTTNLQLVSAPQGTTKVKGNSIVANFPNSPAATLQFTVTVDDLDKLGAQTKLKAHADGEAVFSSGPNASDFVDLTTPILTPKIKGKVVDVKVGSPDSQDYNDTRGLQGATVRLLQNGSAVAGTTTDGKGDYELPIPAAGDYQVEVTQDSPDFDQLAGSSSAPVKQTIDVSAPGPLTAKYVVNAPEVRLPVSLVSRAADLLQAVTNWSHRFSGTAPPIPVSTFPLDVQEAQTQLIGVVTSAPLFNGPLGTSNGDVKATAGGYDGIIRITAALAVLNDEFGPTVKLCDDAAQALGVAFVDEVLTRVATNLATYNINGFGAGPITDAWTRVVKAAISDFSATVLPGLLARFVSDPNERAALATVISEALRLAADTITGQLITDAAFDLVKGTVTALVGTALMNYILDDSALSDPLNPTTATAFGSPTWQAQFNRVVASATGGTYTDPTLGDLRTMDGDYQAWLKVTDQQLDLASNSLKALTLIDNALKDMYDGFKALTSASQATAIQAIRKFLQKSASVISLIKAPTYAIALAAPLSTLYANQSSTAGTLADLLPGQTGNLRPGGAPPWTAGAGVAAATPRATVDASITAYLAFLQQAQTEVSGGQTDQFAALGTQAATAEGALSDYLDALTAKCQAALAHGATAAPLLAFLEAAAAANEQRQLLYVDLMAWDASPTSQRKTCLAQIKATGKAMTQLGTAALAAENALSGVSLPGSLAISETDVPVNVAPGGTASPTLTVTNVGGTALDAGSATLQASGGLSVDGGAQQSLPALGAGQSQVLTWQIDAASTALKSFGSFTATVTAPGTSETSLSDTVLISN